MIVGFLAIGLIAAVLSIICVCVAMSDDNYWTPLHVTTAIMVIIYIVNSLLRLGWTYNNGFQKWQHVMKFIHRDCVTVFEEDDKVTKVVIKPGDNVVIEDDGTITVYSTEAESEG